MGLVLHLGPDISLDVANTTRTPYIIAGHWEGGREQFLCPTVGSNEAVLEVCEKISPLLFTQVKLSVVIFRL